MIAESFAILIIGVLLLITFLHKRHPGYALATLPVFFVPAGHLIITLVLKISKDRFFGIRPFMVVAFADVLALALSCVFVVVFSKNVQSKKIRSLYLITMLAYSVLLGWAYLYNTLSGYIFFQFS